MENLFRKIPWIQTRIFDLKYLANRVIDHEMSADIPKMPSFSTPMTLSIIRGTDCRLDIKDYI